MKNSRRPPAVFQEPDLIETHRARLPDRDVERIVVDNSQGPTGMREMVSRFTACGRQGEALHRCPADFDRFGISKQLENAFSRQVQFEERRLHRH